MVCVDADGPASFREGRLWYTKGGSLIELVEPAGARPGSALDKHYKQECKLFISQLFRKSKPLPDTPKILVAAEKEVQNKNWSTIGPIISAMRSGQWQGSDRRFTPAGQAKYEALHREWAPAAEMRDLGTPPSDVEQPLFRLCSFAHAGALCAILHHCVSPLLTAHIADQMRQQLVMMMHPCATTLP